MTRLAPYKLPFLIGLFCTLWSSAFAAAKIALLDCPPLLFLTARFLLAGAVMLLAAAAYGQKLPSRRDLMSLALLGTVNNAIYLSLSYTGMRSVSAGLAALIISANPILTAFAATAVLRERLTWHKVCGLALGFCGVAIIVKARISGGMDSGHGVMLTFAALGALVIGTILFKLLAPGGGLWVGSGIQNIAGGFALAPVAFAVESMGGITPSWSLFIVLIYVALAVSTIGLLVWFYLLTVAGATAASSYHFLIPPLGVFFGWVLLGEHIALSDMFGIVPVAFGIYLVTRPPAQVLRPAAIADESCITTRSMRSSP
jgi:drug/metabolite transporter (DMT)-like permease